MKTYEIKIQITCMPKGKTGVHFMGDKGLNAAIAAGHLEILSEQILKAVAKNVIVKGFKTQKQADKYINSVTIGELILTEATPSPTLKQ